MGNEVNGTPLIKTQDGAPKYKSFVLRNLTNIPQIKDHFSDEEIFAMEVVGNVLPFKSNNYVVDELIDWDNPREDPIFILTFPQKDMLKLHHFEKMAETLKKTTDKKEIRAVADAIRKELNPHPAGQKDYNVPVHDGQVLQGVQHKYDQTVLFFPTQGQTCHAYCTFCFRWPQFVNMGDLKFASMEIKPVVQYIKQHPEVHDILFTGGDPMVLKAKLFEEYINAILEEDPKNLTDIRIGTKALAYWPYKFVTDDDADQMLRTFEKIIKSGRQLSIMAHFNHYVELSTPAVQKAIKRILETGANIRTQSPIFHMINNSSVVWSKMWREQVRQGCIPYYMFIARDTGAQHYFKVTLERAWQVFQGAYQNVSGLARTVRGPSMSCGPGKVQVLGVTEVNGEKVFALRFLQGRGKDWVHRPFFAKYNPDAIWIDDLEPAFGEEKFFFEDELKDIYKDKTQMLEIIEED